MILTTDIVGASTRRVYGIAGDEVEIILERAGMSVVRSIRTGERFWVRNEFLTDKK